MIDSHIVDRVNRVDGDNGVDGDERWDWIDMLDKEGGGDGAPWRGIQQN